MGASASCLDSLCAAVVAASLEVRPASRIDLAAMSFMHSPSAEREGCLQVRDAMLASSSGDGYRRIVVSRLGAMPGTEEHAWRRSLSSLSAGVGSMVVLELAEASTRWAASAYAQAEIA